MPKMHPMGKAGILTSTTLRAHPFITPVCVGSQAKHIFFTYTYLYLLRVHGHVTSSYFGGSKKFANAPDLATLRDLAIAPIWQMFCLHR